MIKKLLLTATLLMSYGCSQTIAKEPQNDEIVQCTPFFIKIKGDKTYGIEGAAFKDGFAYFRVGGEEYMVPLVNVVYLKKSACMVVYNSGQQESGDIQL